MQLSIRRNHSRLFSQLRVRTHPASRSSLFVYSAYSAVSFTCPSFAGFGLPSTLRRFPTAATEDGSAFLLPPLPAFTYHTAMDLASAFAGAVRQQHAKIALYWGEREYSYQE